MELDTDNTLHQFCITMHLLCGKLPHATVYQRQLLTVTDAQWILILNFDFSRYYFLRNIGLFMFPDKQPVT